MRSGLRAVRSRFGREPAAPGVEGALEAALSLTPGSSVILFEADELPTILWQYGEDELASRVRRRLSKNEHLKIAKEAMCLIHNGERGILAGVIAKAAVSVLEGKPRDLARKRRRRSGSTA